MSGRGVDAERIAAVLDGLLTDLQKGYGIGRYSALKCLHRLAETTHDSPGDHVMAEAQFIDAITEAADRREPWAVTVYSVMRKEWET